MENQTSVKFDELEFIVDVKEAPGYISTLESIRENLRTFMARKFSVLSESSDNDLADAPTFLGNYLDVELLIRGINPPNNVRRHILNTVLFAWGFSISRDLNHTKPPFSVSRRGR